MSFILNPYRYAAAGGGSTPSLPYSTNLRLWLPVNNLVGYSDNDTVPTWTDFSGLGFDGTPPVVASRAVYKTGVVNSQPVLRFAGAGTSHDYYQFGNVMASAAAGEVFIVVKVDADPPPDVSQSGLWKFDPTEEVTHYPYTDGVIYDTFGTTARKTTGNPTASLAAWNIYNVSSAAGAWTSRINGVQHYTTATNTVGWSATPLIGYSNSDRGLDGDIAEVIVYNAVLGSTDRTTILDYLAAKYGITV